MDTDQLRTILWLRWRLSRNQWSRAGGLAAALTLIVVAIALAIRAAFSSCRRFRPSSC
jgi:hypothetical protein